MNELVEEIDGLEIVDDDDENSEDDSDGDVWFLLYVRTLVNSVYLTFNFFDSKHVWKLPPALWSGRSTRLSKYPILHRRCFYEFRKNLQYAFWCAYNFYIYPSVSHQLSFHTKTRTISYMHIFSIFGRLYHINSETDMHIFSIFSRKYHINRHIFVYAFAPGRVYIKLNAFFRNVNLLLQ